MQNNSEKDGPRPRPRSFVGGNSFEFAYDGHSGGIKPSTRSLDRKEKRPMSLYESLSLDMYAARRHSTSSARPDEDGDHHDDQAREFSRLNSKEKADEVNKERENVRHSVNNEHGEEGLGQRKSSDAADTRKAARQLYAELSSPPLKTVSGDEKFNAVSRLRSLFDQTNSAPPSRNYSVPQRSRDLTNLSKSADRRSFEENRKSFEGDKEAGSKARKSEPAKFEFHHRRPKFEKVEADKKRKLFAPPPPVKLDTLLKRESPRSPEEKREWRFRRSSSSKENEQPAEKDEKVTEQEQPVEKERKDSKEKIEQTSAHKIPERKKSFEIDDIVDRSSTQHSHHHGKQSSVEKDEFTIVHERRRSLPKKRSSSFEFTALEDNIEVFGKNTIDINAMLGLEPPREDPVAEEENDDKEVSESEHNNLVEEDKLVFEDRNEKLQKSEVPVIEKQNEVEHDEPNLEIAKEEVSSQEEVCTDKEDEEQRIEEESEASIDRVKEEDDVVLEKKSNEEDYELHSENFEIDNKIDLPSSEEEFVRIDSLEVKEEEYTVDLDRVMENVNVDFAVGKNVLKDEDDVMKEECKEVEDSNEFVTEEDDGHKKEIGDNDNYDSSLVNNLEEAEIDAVVEVTTNDREERIDDDDKNYYEEVVKDEKEQMQQEEEKIVVIEEELVHSSLKLDEAVENETEGLATEIIISDGKRSEEIFSQETTEETPQSAVVENLVESTESKVIIDEEFIAAEEYKQEESEPDFSMLNGEIDDKTSLGYDSFDSFALNVREKGAQNIVDQTISEAIQEVVEKHREDVLETSDGLLDLSAVEEDNVEKEDLIGNSEVHDDDLEHKLKVAKALLESEESAVLADEEVKIEKEDFNDEEDDDHGDSDDDHKDTAEDYVSINAPDVSVDVNVCVEDENALHDTVELDDDEYDSDHESALSEGSPHEYTFEENAYDDHDGDHDYSDNDHHDHDYHDGSYDEDNVDGDNEDETCVEDKTSESYQEVQNQDVSEVHEDYDNDDVSSEVIELPPAPPHSCLSAKGASEKASRKVSFKHSVTDVIYTYSPEEYNRGSNAAIDTVTASAEWELEKRVEEKDIFSVDLDKSAGGLGLSIIGLGVSTESGVEKLGIFIKSLTPNGAAHRDRRIQVQDQILEVNGISLVGVTQEFAARTLKNTSGTVRFLMGRDKTKKHYQAPTSTADPVLQELEQKHNIEMSELVTSRQKAEERAAIAEHNLEEIREALLDAEDRLHLAESELEESRDQIDLMKQSPHISSRKMKKDIKKPKQQGKQSERVEELEGLVSELTGKLESSDERLSSVQEENEAKIEDLRLKLDEAEHNAVEAKKENDHLVSMLQKNAEKLNEAEQNLTLAEKANADNMNQNQRLKDENNKLKAELEILKQENSKMRKSLDVKEECHDHVKLIGRLEEQINDLKEELELKRQFSDVVVAERDSFKTLVNNLERAHEKLQEAEEKMQIENAVKKMSYENKIQELEETIRELKGADSTDGAPHKKLFPAIERPKVEREIEIKVENSQPIESKPYIIPPRDYEDEAPEKEVPEEVPEKDIYGNEAVKEAVDEAVPDKEVPEKEVSEKEMPEVAADNVAVEKEAPEHVAFEIEAAVAQVEVEPVESAVPEDDVIVETQLVVEQCTPDFSFIKDDEIPANKISEDDSTIPEKPEDTVINIVNPIQKPPRRYSDINTATRTKDLPRQDKVIEEQSQEEIIVEAEKERSESIRNAFEQLEIENSDRPKQIIEIKRSDTFEVVIKKDPVPESSRQGEKTLQSEDSFFKDLPESSVDSPDASDNEIRVETHDKEGNDEANVEKVTQVNVMHEISPISSTSTALTDKPDKSETDEMGKPDLDKPDIESKDKETKANPDRSSFLEALSKNPSFGSWLNGELTVIEQDRKEEQAEEIASKVAEQKERKFSSSSSSSSDSEKEHEDHHDDDTKNNNLSTSIRLDESYLKASQPAIEDHDDTDSPLLRLESADMGPLSEPVMADRPISVNFDDVVPATTVLENTAQLDKRKLASAIPRKSPRKPSTPNIKEGFDERTEQKPLPSMQVPSNLSASREHISEEKQTNKVVNIDYGGKKDGEKDKRKSIFSFLPKFGGKKKHKRSMENLLAPEESHGHAGTRESSPARSERDDEEGVVPFDVKHGTESHFPAQQNTQTSVPVAFEVKIVNGDSDSATLVSSGDSHSGTSSLIVPPESSNAAGSTENLAEDVEHEDGPERLSKENRHSWINRPVNEWDRRQVGLWLIRMDLEAYSQTFQERNVDGNELLNLNGAKLKELGVMHGDDRALIKRKIKEFKLNIDHKSKDSKKDGKSKDKPSKKIFWKGKYTVNQ